VTTPRLWFFTAASGQHHMYELRRLEQFSQCGAIYREYNIDPATLVNELNNNGIDLTEEFKNMQDRGNFLNQKGKFSVQMAAPSVGELEFSEMRNQTGVFDVINGRLYISNSAYFWSKQSFEAGKNYEIFR
jgi:hypothetical protein